MDAKMRSWVASTREVEELLPRIALGRETVSIARQLRAAAARDGDAVSATTERVLAKRRFKPLSTEWFALRGKLVTASDMACK